MNRSEKPMGKGVGAIWGMKKGEGVFFKVVKGF
jgi:hypothetical protein